MSSAIIVELRGRTRAWHVLVHFGMRIAFGLKRIDFDEEEEEEEEDNEDDAY